MVMQIADRVKETTTTTGTGAFALAGAIGGFRAFSAVLANQDTCCYTAQAVDTNGNPTGDWEIGIGTYTASGNTLARTVLLASSTGAAVSFSAGTKQLWVDLPAAQIGALSGCNRIINGACNVAQRGSSVAVSTSGVLFGGPDRFRAVLDASAGGQFTQSWGTITYGGVARNAVVQTVNTAIASRASTNAWEGINQIVEGVNCFDLVGQPVVLSFLFNTNVTGIYSVSLQDGGGGNSYTTTFNATANTPVKVVIPITSLPTSLSVPNNTGSGLIARIGALNTGTFQAPALNAWQSGLYFTASGATNWGATAANFIAAAEIQLEPGVVATPFTRLPYTQDLALCQRYLLRIGSGSGLEMVATGMITSAAVILATINFPVAMRTKSPTLLTSNMVGSSATSAVNGSSQALTWGGTQVTGYQLTCSGAAWTTGQAGLIYANAGFFQLDCEI
jgi:hypothetical protein